MKKFLLMLILSALTLGAEAMTGYWQWEMQNAVQNGYIKDETPKATTSALKGWDIYIMPAPKWAIVYSGNYYWKDQADLLAALYNGSKTVADVKAESVDVEVSRASDGKVAAYVGKFSREGVSSETTYYYYQLAFSPNEDYVYMSRADKSNRPGNSAQYPATISFAPTYTATFNNYTTYNGAGWYRVPLKARKPIVVEPAEVANATTNIYEGAEGEVLAPYDDEVAAHRVATNAIVRIVYTANDGYLFGNGAKAITNELVASSNPTVDTLDYGAFVTNNVVVTNSQGEVLGEITLSKDWVAAVEAENPGVALGDTQDNGITLLENEILGLNGTTPNDIPVIAPVQSADETTVTFALDNVDIDDTSCAKVTYRVVPSEGESSKSVGPDETVPMALPDTGVRYYKIEVDVGATKQ